MLSILRAYVLRVRVGIMGPATAEATACTVSSREWRAFAGGKKMGRGGGQTHGPSRIQRG